MTSIKNPYNPLSIEHQVRRRIEQKSSGVSLSEHHHHFRKLNNPKSSEASSRCSAEDSDLSLHFMSLLFSDTMSPKDTKATNQSNRASNEDLKKTGTNTFFCPLKKQEESNSLPIKEKKDFSLVIENAAAGSMTLNGSWTQGIMTVQLQMSKPLEVQEKKILIAILKKKLSHELGVPMEIQID